MAKRQRQRRRERRWEHAKRQGWRTRHSVVTGAGIAAGAVLGLSSSAQAASTHYYVGNTDGSSTAASDCYDPTNTDCTLADAIDAANANSGYSDVIYFSSTISGQPIVLTSDLPTIDDPVYIVGTSPSQTVISGDGSYRIFNINMTNSGDPVGLYSLTLTHGYADYGGAIDNDNALLGVFDTVLSGNTATARGGAVYEPGNYSNGANDFFGYDTFEDNHADIGGAIAADVSWGIVRTATFNENSADAGDGGAIYSNGGYGYIIDSTLSGNHATGTGGGVATDRLNFYGTILANDTGSPDPDLSVSCSATCYVAHDLVESPGTSGIAGVPTIITGADPQLGPLQNNGGITPTLKPAASSPVVDQSYSYSYTDQRLGDRIVDNPNVPNVSGGNGADIGSVELTLDEGPQAIPPAPAPALAPHKKKKCKKKKKHRSAEAAKKKKCKKKKKRSAVATASRSSGTAGFALRTPSGLRLRATRGVGHWPDGAAHRAFRLRP
jgi:predicted outer membrane repeat protein